MSKNVTPKLENNSKYIKPVALININRQELTVMNNKILNYFIYLSTSNQDIDKQLFINNIKQKTSLTSIAKGINMTTRRKEDLIKSIINLGKATANYGVFSLENDSNEIKQKSEGVMTYVDFVEILDNGQVNYKLGEKFFSYISDMLVGKERYFRPSLEIKNKLTSISSTVLYELASSYTNNLSIPLIKLDNGFMDLLGMSRTYLKNKYDFNKRVMHPALSQLNEKGIIDLDYEIVDKPDGQYIKIFKIKPLVKTVLKPYTLFEFIAKQKNADSIKGYANSLEKSYNINPNSIEHIETWKAEYEEYLKLYEKIANSSNKIDLLEKYIFKKLNVFSLEEVFYLDDASMFHKLLDYIDKLKSREQIELIVTLLSLKKEEFSLIVFSQDEKNFYDDYTRENWIDMFNTSILSRNIDSVTISVHGNKYPLLIQSKLNIDALRTLEYEFSKDVNSEIGFILENNFYEINIIDLQEKKLILRKGKK